MPNGPTHTYTLQTSTIFPFVDTGMKYIVKRESPPYNQLIYKPTYVGKYYS